MLMPSNQLYYPVLHSMGITVILIYKSILILDCKFYYFNFINSYEKMALIYYLLMQCVFCLTLCYLFQICLDRMSLSTNNNSRYQHQLGFFLMSIVELCRFRHFVVRCCILSLIVCDNGVETRLAGLFDDYLDETKEYQASKLLH